MKLTITENGKKRNIYHSVGYDASFGGNSTLAEIGIGSANKIDKLEVLWPVITQNTTIINDIKANQKIKIVEGQEGFKQMNLPAIKFKTNHAGHHHH